MSAEEQQGTNILLPKARIAVFSDDDDTLSSVQGLQDDWRFARVEFTVVQGDVEKAIATYQSQSSPDLLIIQTEDINDGFTERLGDLSAHCDEGTAAIIVGPVNDVYLYRQMIEMGVSDYLVKPIRPEVISEVIAKALVSRLGVSDSSLIAFIGAKGGVGTSVLTQISACVSAQVIGQKTILVDAGGAWSSASVGLGFDPSASLKEVVRAVASQNDDNVKRMIQSLDDKLSVLSTGADAMLDSTISAEQGESVLDNLMVKYPTVLVDLSCAEASLRRAVLSRASHVVVVSEPTVTSLRFCRSLLKEISDVRGGKSDAISLVINKVGLSKAHEVAKADIEEALEFKVSSTIDYMPSVFLKHESEIFAATSDKNAVDLIKGIGPLIGGLLSQDIPETGNGSKNSGFLGGFLNKLSAK